MADRPPFLYPPANREDTVDDYHCTEVADPYRWLEDPLAADTQAFVAAQNDLTLPYLASLPERTALAERMRETWNVPRTSPPVDRSGVNVCSHNDAHADQPVIMVENLD